MASPTAALLTARAGVARAGACRSGYVPTRTDNDTPGGAGPRPIWSQVSLPTSSWTSVVTT